MELAPKTAVQIFFVILVAVVFIAFGKTYSNESAQNTTEKTDALWTEVDNAYQTPSAS